MNCPIRKNVTLLMSEKKGVEIDYCPECRGIWLDRGELEKIMEKEDNYISNKVKEEPSKKNIDDKPKKPKRESFMSEIFDIFGGD